MIDLYQSAEGLTRGGLEAGDCQPGVHAAWSQATWRQRPAIERDWYCWIFQASFQSAYGLSPAILPWRI